MAAIVVSTSDQKKQCNKGTSSASFYEIQYFKVTAELQEADGGEGMTKYIITFS